MGTIARELSVTYGTLITFGNGSSTYLIDGKLTVRREYESASLSFDVVVISPSEAQFATDCNALETAVRTPRQKVVVTYGSATHQRWDPALSGPTPNSGFDTVGTAEKSGSVTDTGRSRRYRVTFTCGQPADLAGQNGRQTSQTTVVALESGRRRAFFSGTYTALGSNNARQQYVTSIAAWTSAQLASFGGTWEGPFDQQATTNDTDKTCSFSEAWEELIYNQSLGTLDDLTIRRQRLKIARASEAPGDTFIVGGNVSRLETYEVEYECAIDKGQTQDLVAVYATKVKPFLLAEAAKLGASAMALVNQAPTYDRVENRIEVRLTFLVVTNNQLVFLQIRTDDAEDTGRDLVAAWTGDRLSKFNFQGPGSLTRTVTTIRREVDTTAGGAQTSVAGGGGGGGGASTGGGGQDPFGIFGINAPGTAGGVSGGGISSASSGQAGAALNVVAGEPVGASPGVPEPTLSPDGGTLRKIFKGRATATTPLTMGRPGDPQVRVIDTTTVERWEYIVEIPAAPTRTPTGNNGNVQGGQNNGAAAPQGGGSAGSNATGVNLPGVQS